MTWKSDSIVSQSTRWVNWLLFNLLTTCSRGTREVLFVCGEIDTREGIQTAISKKYYASLEEAVTSTVRTYVEGIELLSAKHDLRFWIHPVTPPVNPKCMTSSSWFFVIYDACFH